MYPSILMCIIHKLGICHKLQIQFSKERRSRLIEWIEKYRRTSPHSIFFWRSARVTSRFLITWGFFYSWVLSLPEWPAQARESWMFDTSSNGDHWAFGNLQCNKKMFLQPSPDLSLNPVLSLISAGSLVLPMAWFVFTPVCTDRLDRFQYGADTSTTGCCSIALNGYHDKAEGI